MSFFASDSVAPFFRFVMELTSWIWMLLTFWFFAIPSIISLAFLNVPGDKQPKEDGVTGFAIPGKLRVILEVGTATLGLLISVIYFPIPVPILQLLITIAYLRTDSPRLSWLWGWSTYPPEYVTQLHKMKKQNNKNN